MNKNFDEFGFFIGNIPRSAIDDCTRPFYLQDGEQTFIVVVRWMNYLGFSCPRKLAEKYLDGFGAWDDLQAVSDEIINSRVFWIACNNIKEEGEWLGLID